ncbi:MAG: signal peptide peptidase SppA [Planctomycetes bacterium]|nr:signal peptide peptidase SppA [Planctomycetota bacterium]
MQPDLVLEGAQDLASVPHLEQYFGVWGVEEQSFRALVRRFDGYNLAEHLAHVRGAAGHVDLVARARRDYRVASGVAVIDVAGTLLKYVSSMDDGTSTVLTRQQLRRAAADPAVNAILLRMDTPGGVIAGTAEFAGDVAAAGAKKPLWAYCDDLCASAGYWPASQARKVFANELGRVGSIGVFTVLYDQSEEAAKLGVKVHVVRTGAYKGAGVPGTEITDEHLAEAQRQVDRTHEHFLNAISAGRNLPLEKVRELADGRTYFAADAKKLKLIDGVQSFDDTLAQLAELGLQKSSKGRTRAMTEATTELTAAADPVGATLAELKAACPGAEPAFLLGQLEHGATVAQATSAFLAHTRAELANRETELKEARAAAAGAGVAGVAPLTDDAATSAAGKAAAANATEAFWADVAEREKGGLKRSAAVRLAVKSDPERHAAMLAEANAARTTK